MTVGEPTNSRTGEQKTRAQRLWRGSQYLVLVGALVHAASLIVLVIADELQVWRWPLIQAVMLEPGWGIPIYRVVLLYGMPWALLLVLLVLGYRLAARRWLATRYRLAFPLTVLGLQAVTMVLALWTL